jgi:hypothetical protein
MRRTVQILMVVLGVGAGLFLVERADAQSIVVEKSTVGCQAGRWTDITATLNPVPGLGDPVNITGIDDSWTAIRVRITTGSGNVGAITLTGSRLSAEPLDLLIVPSAVDCPPISPEQSIANPAGTSWSGLTYGANSESVRNAVRLVAAISGDLTGSVECGTVYRLQVGGNIRAAVTAAGPNREGVGAVGVVVAGAILNGVQPDNSAPTGSIAAVAGDTACCSTYGLLHLDFNEDGNTDQDDVAAMIHYIAGGGCP